MKKEKTLILIGGKEDKEKNKDILQEVAKRVGKGKLTIATVASTVGDELWEEYRKVFRQLGVKKISHLDVVTRKESVDQKALTAVKGASAVFFTGGDQLKITSELGGTPISGEIQKIYESGGLIAGTSAGASVMSETMLVSGDSGASYRIGSNLRMAPGLGFVKDVIVDQHFAERGRVSRLLGAIALNPKFLGIGIDEDTGVIVRNQECLEIIGGGAVYVIDAHDSTENNVSNADLNETLSIFNVRMHLLSKGDKFSMSTRQPKSSRTSRAA